MSKESEIACLARHSAQLSTQLSTRHSVQVQQANQRLGWGIGLGAFAVVSYAVFGATCPLCLVVGPALIGSGLVGRMRARSSGSGGDIAVGSDGACESATPEPRGE